MSLRDGFGKAIKPTVLGWLGFVVFSSAFVGGYFGISYQHYIRTYQSTQAQEIETVRQKTEAALKQLKDLLELAELLLFSALSKTSLKSSETAQEHHLREILNTVSLLKPSSGLPSLQKIAFYKLSSPQMLVTRFGVVPFNFSNSAIEKLISQHWHPELILKEKAIMGRINVGEFKNTLEGVLEIQVNLAELKSFLGTYRTIRFDDPLESDFLIDNNHFPFLTVKNTPVSFGAYIGSQPSYHWMIMSYFGFFLLLLGGWLRLPNKYTQRSYRQTIENLKDSLATTKTSEESMKTSLSKQQRDFEAYTVSRQAQKDFQAALIEKHKSQAKHIAGFLEKIKAFPNSFQGHEREKNMGIEACLKQAHALSNGLWDPVRKDTVDLKSALKNLQLLFAEKLHQSNIHLEIEDLDHVPLFKGDSLLMDLLLINVVGKAIYRVPNNGAVSVTIKETLGFVHLQVQDTGYGGIMLAEKKIRESFNFFIEENILKWLCKEQGIYKKYSKSEDYNLTHLVVPLVMGSEKGSNSNVVQLFS